MSSPPASPPPLPILPVQYSSLTASHRCLHEAARSVDPSFAYAPACLDFCLLHARASAYSGPWCCSGEAASFSCAVSPDGQLELLASAGSQAITMAWQSPSPSPAPPPASLPPSPPLSPPSLDGYETASSEEELAALLSAPPSASPLRIFLPEGTTIHLAETFRVGSGADVTIASEGEGATWGSDGVRHLAVRNGASLTLRGLHLHGGRAASGGAIYANDANVTIGGCRFSNCSAASLWGGRGGAIHAERSALQISSCFFTDCTASIEDVGALELAIIRQTVGGSAPADLMLNVNGNGGAVSLTGRGSQLLLLDCWLAGCTADLKGGALEFVGETRNQSLEVAVVERCVFTSCGLARVITFATLGVSIRQYGEAGGAIYFDADSHVCWFRSCLFTECFSTGTGGALHVVDPFLFMEDCRFEHCVSFQQDERTHGGGMYFDYGSCTLLRCALINCTAERNGGGLFALGTLVNVTHTVFSSCSLDMDVRSSGGGALLRNSPTSTITRCTFDDCSSAQGGGVYADGPGLCAVFSSNFTRCIASRDGGGAGTEYALLSLVDARFDGCIAASGGFAAAIGCPDTLTCDHALNLHGGEIIAPCDATAAWRARHPAWEWLPDDLSAPIVMKSSVSLAGLRFVARGLTLHSECGCTLIRDDSATPMELAGCEDTTFDILTQTWTLAACGPYASCAVATLCPSLPDGPVVPACFCELPREPLFAEAALEVCFSLFEPSTQPYISRCGCTDPIRSTELIAEERGLLMSIAKTAAPSSVRATHDVTIRTAGTALTAAWSCADACVSYTADSGWLRLPLTSGTFAYGADGPVNTSLLVEADASTLRARAAPYEALLHIEVRRPAAGGGVLLKAETIPLLLYVAVDEVLVGNSVWTCASAEPGACAAAAVDDCAAAAAAQPSNVSFAVGASLSAYFQTCDVNSLPAGGATLTAQLSRRAAAAAASSPTPQQVAERGEGLFAISVSISSREVVAYTLSLRLLTSSGSADVAHTLALLPSGCAPPLLLPAAGSACQCAAGFFISPPAACEACAAGKHSSGAAEGAASCDECADGTYAAGGACVSCPARAACPAGTRLATLALREGTWRASANSSEVWRCDRGGVPSRTCAGGAAGEYCAANLTGPLCRVCALPSHYFSATRGECVGCPSSGALAAASAGAVALCLLVWMLLRLRLLQAIATRCLSAETARALLTLLRAFDVRTKLKIGVAFYQVLVVLPAVYNTSLPDEFYSWFSFTQAFEVGALLERISVPLSCFGGFEERLLILTLGPLVAVCATALLGALHFLVTTATQREKLAPARLTARRLSRAGSTLRRSSESEIPRGRPSLVARNVVRVVVDAAASAGSMRGRVLQGSLPFALPLCFFFVASSSKAVFEAWGCVAFTYDSTASPPVQRRFLFADLRVECDTPRHDAIVRNAAVLLFLWPVGVPLLFSMLLLSCRKEILSMRSTPLSRSIAFLYREFVPAFYFWETLDVMRRIALSGLLLVVFPDQEVWRLVAALLLSIFFVCGTLAAQPYTLKLNTLVSVAAQLSLCVIYLSALLLKLHEEITAIATESEVVFIFGFSDVGSFMAIIMILAVIMLAFFICVMLYAALSARSKGKVRLRHNRQYPVLQLEENFSYHLFISHVWASAQDQAAVIKRRLQTMLPSVVVFLDVDDLTDISALEAYVQQSVVVLTFLSRHYFASRNCLRELRAAIYQKPLLRVHEADEARGGQSLDKLRNACPVDIRAPLFRQGVGPIVQWHRLFDFQLVSLRMMLHAVLLHDSAYKPLLGEPKSLYQRGVSMEEDEIAVYMEGAITEQAHTYATPPLLVYSLSNPGAAMAANLVAMHSGGGVAHTTEMPDEMAEAYSSFADELERTAAAAVRVENPEVDVTAVSVIDEEHSTPQGGARAAARRVGEATPPRVPLKFASDESRDRAGSKGGKDRSTRRRVKHFFLLYLNEVTFGEPADAVRLEAQIRAADACDVPVVMIHENDGKRGGCPCARFFDTTPPALITDGLYSDLAIPFFPKPHLAVSLKMFERALGGRSVAAGWRAGSCVGGSASWIFPTGISSNSKGVGSRSQGLRQDKEKEQRRALNC
ncbi:hypothetical protein AB1Y20_004417 [Prymnesium parvum]|uniref:TIR domain-containing protein n=1 Tax=Prymnesium parvum TaxID=97485 RepID=A0AB34IWB5_PRYPA